MRKICSFVFIMASILYFADSITAEDEKTNIDYGQSLVTFFTEFDKNLRDKPLEAQKNVIKNILPTKVDIELLFPSNAEQIWNELEPNFKNLMDNADKVAAELTKQTWIKLEPYDIRKNKELSENHAKVFKMMPESIPVYGLEEKFSNGESSNSRAYIFVNGRWIFFKSLTSIPRIVEKANQKE